MPKYIKYNAPGFRQLEKALLELDDEVRDKIAASAARLAMKPVLTAAQRLVPIDDQDLYATLRLRSKQARKTKNGRGFGKNEVAKAWVAAGRGGVRGKRADALPLGGQALQVEFGTKEQPAQPFLRPALRNNASLVISLLSAALGKKIEAAAKRLRSKHKR